MMTGASDGATHPTTLRRADSVAVSDRCTACGLCLITCGEGALVRAPKKPLVIDERCTSCGACIEVCPVGAISEVVTGAVR